MSAKIRINSTAEQDGRITDELTARINGEDICKVTISNPMTIDCVIEKLELLAWKLRIHKQNDKA